MGASAILAMQNPIIMLTSKQREGARREDCFCEAISDGRTNADVCQQGNQLKILRGGDRATRGGGMPGGKPKIYPNLGLLFHFWLLLSRVFRILRRFALIAPIHL